MKLIKWKYTFLLIFTLLIWDSALHAQKPERFGTTAANFLEIGVGSAGNAMGEAYVSLSGDLSSLYWNPAGLARLERNQALFMYQPWVADIKTIFVGVGLAKPPIGTFTIGLFNVNYGSEEVTNLEMQEGTGEIYTANEYAFSLAFSRLITDWFAFGVAGKLVTSQIWHMTASAVALDLGVIVNTQFFSMTGSRTDGLSIGMSISNYGTRMRYDGIDLLTAIDMLPLEHGNYRDVPGQYRLSEWELPLIFRIGVSIKPLVLASHELVLAVDALHPNNNAESINVGAQYQFRVPNRGNFYLRGGYKALGLEKAEFGQTLGGGVELYLMGNRGLIIDYAFKPLEILGNTHSYSLGLRF